MSACKSAEDHRNEHCDAQATSHTSEITALPMASTPVTSYLPQSDSGICLTPQSQGDVASPQQQTGIGSFDGVLSHTEQKDVGVSLTPCDGDNGASSPPQQKDNDADLSPFGQISNVSQPPEGKDTSLSQPNQDSELTPPEQKSQHRGVNSQGHGNMSLPLEQKDLEKVSSSAHQNTAPLFVSSTETMNDEGETQNESCLELSSPQLSNYTVDSSSQTLQNSTSTIKKSNTAPSSTHPTRVENIPSDEPRPHIPTPELPKFTRSHLQSKSSGSKTPDNFTFQTKYLVLQFLQQATNEHHLLTVSQNSLSTTSESEPRLKSHARLLRQQWQDNRSQSSPISPVPSRRPRPLAKTKGSRSSPNLKDADFFKDVPKVQTPSRRRRMVPLPKTAVKNSRKSPRPSNPVSPQMTFLRSVSQTTENSEHGTYLSDADDELDTSFDSSQQGSITSASFRNRLPHFHEHQGRSGRVRLPTLHSDAESLAENSLSMAEESITSPVEEEATLPILSLDQINLEQLPVSSDTQHARVNDYLVRMSESSTADTDKTLQNDDGAGVDEVDSPPFHNLPHFNHTPTNSEQVLQSQDLTEDEVQSMGFEPHETHSDPVGETEEGACGGMDVDEASDEDGGRGLERPGLRGDRSKLTLDLNAQQENAYLIDAVLTLQQEIEEEMSSFESECEEALQSLHSDHSWLSHTSGFNLGRSFSPETAEAARILARIGDDIQQRHFENLQGAVGRFMLDNCAGIFTYENFRDAALTALDKDLNGWRQVATLLLYSQHVALQLAQCGRRGLHRVVDFTVQLLADTTADFIVQHGGWYGVSSSIPSSPDGTAPGNSQLNPFHDHFNTTTVGERSLSAPDLTCALQQQTPNDGAVPTPTDHVTPEEEKKECPESATSGDAGDSITDSVTISASVGLDNVDGADCIDSTSVAVVEKGEEGDGEEKVEGNGSGGEGIVSVPGSAVVNASLLTKTAVSVGLLAVGAALAFSFSRG